MSNTSCIEITMLGGFSITYGKNSIDDKSKYSKKCLYLLEYLIAHRHSSVTQNDLIELLWPEETSENPTGALKTLLHRTRALLKNIGLPKEIILQRNNTYLWNNLFPCTIDIEEFEQLHQKIKLTNESDKLHSLYEHAFNLYTGDFLPQSAYESWVVPINTYYHSIYLKLTYDYIKLLISEYDYPAISSICCKALSIDNYDEDLHYYFILSLYRSGKASVACSQYETSNKLLYSKYNATPSSRFLSLNREIHQTAFSSEDNIHTLQKHLQDNSKQNNLVICDYDLFQELYQIESYTCSRLGEPLLLCLITVNNRIRGKATSSTIAKSMEVLIDCFKNTLRAHDIISKYSHNQYVLLLPDITQAKGQDYLKKIVNDFSKSAFRSLIQLEYALLPIAGTKNKNGVRS